MDIIRRSDILITSGSLRADRAKFSGPHTDFWSMKNIPIDPVAIWKKKKRHEERKMTFK